VKDLADPDTSADTSADATLSAAHTPPVAPPTPPPPTEAELQRAKEAAEVAAADIATEMKMRTTRLREEGRLRDAAAKESARAFEEAVREKNATAKAELASRRQQQRDEVLSANARQMEQRAEQMSRLAADLAKEGDDEDGRRVAAGAAAAQARATVDAWRIKQAMPTRMPLAEPRTPSEFTQQYSLLRKEGGASLVAYLKLIPPERCRDIFCPEVPPDVLLVMTKAMKEYLEQCNEADASLWCATWLSGLSKAQRFEMTVLMLDKPTKVALDALFATLSVRGVAAGAIDKLRKTYS